MKTQDAVFVVVFIALAVVGRSKLFVIAGLLSLLLAIPLFATWTFFTAERLTWYAAACIATACLYYLFYENTKRTSYP